MTREELDRVSSEIEDFRDKLGEVIVDALFDDENTSLDIVKSVLGCFDTCQTDREFEIAERMLTAVCSWNMDTLVNTIRERDNDPDFVWESV